MDYRLSIQLEFTKRRRGFIKSIKDRMNSISLTSYYDCKRKKQ